MTVSRASLALRLQLARAALRRHRLRTTLAILGVSVAGAMLLDMVMMSSGMQRSFRELLDTGGFALRLSPKGTVPFDSDATLSNASEITKTLQRVPEVEAVSPVLGASVHVDVAGRDASAFGIGIDPMVQGDYTLEQGREPDANGFVANEQFLQRTAAQIGDTLRLSVGYDPQLRTYLGQRSLVLAGRAKFRYLGANDAAVALPLETMQAMRGTEGRDHVSIFVVRLRQGANADSVARRIDSLIPAVSALSVADAVKQADERLSYFRQLALILGSVSFVVGFLLVTTLVTVSVNERAGEIAVLRAIGVSRINVVLQVIAEGVVIALGGAMGGLVLGLVTARYLNGILADFPGLPAALEFFVFDPRDAGIALGLLALTGVFAGAYPAWRAASLPIAGTLRREAVA